MPSRLPRVSFVINEEELEMVKQYQQEHNIKSLSKAVISMIEQGLVNEQKRIATQNKERPADDGELSKVEIDFFNEFRALPASHKGLAASLCLALIRELVRHQKVGTETEVSVPAGSGH